MQKLRIDLKENSYDIFIEKGALSRLSFYIKKVYTNKKIYIVTDDHVQQYYLHTVIEALEHDYTVDYVVIPSGEASKSLDVYRDVVTELLKKDIRRNELLLALGGGVTGDLTGFIAATLFRGLPYVNVPTSLLSQMDSSIGGKTGIDFLDRKNIIGAFKQPKLVIIDPNTLDTLPVYEKNNGMGELIKHAVLGNALLFEKLKKHPAITEEIIYESLSVKKHLVELDPFDQKERMMLNLGHTFGHIIELKKGYRHGEAVGIGMLLAIKLGIDLGITPKHCYLDVLDVLKGYGLPCDCSSYEEYLNEVKFDKKNLAGTISFILIEEIGKAILYPMTENELKGLKK